MPKPWRRNQRSAAAKQYRDLYKTDAWRRLRLAHLSKEPLCRMCADEGRTVAATIVDHVNRHFSDWTMFFGGELQSLCKQHHDSKKQSIERRGYDTSIGADGWPTDPKHPTFR